MIHEGENLQLHQSQWSGTAAPGADPSERAEAPRGLLIPFSPAVSHTTQPPPLPSLSVTLSVLSLTIFFSFFFALSL